MAHYITGNLRHSIWQFLNFLLSQVNVIGINLILHWLKRETMDYNSGSLTRRHSFLTSKREVEIISTISSMDGKSSRTTRQVHSSSALPRVKSLYVPSFYHNQDKMLTRKITDFLKKPPNSQEYFEMLWKLWKQRESAQFRYDEGNSDTARSAPVSPDEISKKLQHLLPEKRTIQSMILPPIRDGCVSNYHDKFMGASRNTLTTDSTIDVVDRLKYCRYLRLKPERQRAWENSWHLLQLHYRLASRTLGVKN